MKFVKAEDMAKVTSGFGKYTLLDIRPEVDFLAVRKLLLLVDALVSSTSFQ